MKSLVENISIEGKYRTLRNCYCKEVVILLSGRLPCHLFVERDAAGGGHRDYTNPVLSRCPSVLKGSEQLGECGARSEVYPEVLKSLQVQPPTSYEKWVYISAADKNNGV